MDKDHALVAVSTGLLQNMTQEEVEAVLAHEVSHIANGDMVTLALMQGVVNTFVIFFARLIGHFVDRVLLSSGQNQEQQQAYQGYGIGYFVTVMIAEIFLSILASIIVLAFSRYREFRADHGGASLTSPYKMAAALERLQQYYHPSHLPSEIKAFGISGGNNAFARLFMSHPPLEERIARLKAMY